MIPYTGDFATAIKEQARDVNIVIAYKNGDNYIFCRKTIYKALLTMQR